MKRLIFISTAAWTLALASAGNAAESDFNYAEALQKCLYFFEAQQSGALSPNNRVEWRGPACLTDGQDIGRDLSGGWYDAGDHWTANLTMSFAAMTLAWSAIEQPDGWVKNRQMDELLESLIHVNRYFLKCVLNPDCKNPASELEVAIGCGGKDGVESPNVHAMWAAAEIAHLMTQRPTFRLNKQTPGGDIPGAMAAAMAASSMVIREHAAALKGKKGYDELNGAAFADLLLDRAEKLVLFARANSGPVITDKLPKAEQDAIRKQRREALRADGKVVETGYRSDPFDKVFTAATFLQRAHLAKNPQFGTKWFDFANEIFEKEYKAENNHDWWKDYSAGGIGKVGAYNMMRLAPGEEKFHAELQLYCSRFCEYKATPGGLRLREWSAHEYGSLRHANNAAVIALYYSEYVEKSPVIQGNTWWKGGKSNAQLKELFAREARRQVDYALGANPYGRSYLVGFGHQPFNHVHHRGAYGAWAGFEHFIKGKADDRKTSRHILYGALVAGPDHNDVFLCGKEQLSWLPVTGTNDHDFFYLFPNRSEPVRKEGYQWNSAEPPFQDVMDSQFNEVALDYNAGFTANLAWLCAHGFSNGQPLPDHEFPPKAVRNESLDLLTTDREFFVAAKKVGDALGEIEIEATLWNRSRWPARITNNFGFRYFFTLDGDATVEQVQASATGHDKAKVSQAKLLGGKTAYVEIRFPDDAIYPGNLGLASRSIKLRLAAPRWDNANDWSARDLGDTTGIQPRLPVYDDETQRGGVMPPLSDKAPITTFHIGNSLTDTIDGWLKPVAACAGHALEFHRFTIPGAPTDWLWDHPGQGFGDNRVAEAFPALRPIHHLTTQPFGGHDRSIENEAEYSGRFFELCRKHNPDGWHWLYCQWPNVQFAKDTWAKGEGATKSLKLAPAKTWQEGVGNHLAYTEAVRQRMDDLQEGRPVRIVPGGVALAKLKDAIDAGKGEGLGEFFAEIFTDDIHLSAKGRYLVACVFYACFFAESPAGKVSPLSSGLTDAQARLCQRLAWESVQGYRWAEMTE